MSDQRTRIDEAVFIIRSTAGSKILSLPSFNPIRFTSSDSTLATRLASRMNATVSSETEGGVLSILL
jgi:hypothetical protein